ncbi:hypothetical protein XENTR_v10016044 [Xenopus tropicalis]|nr:hypothetical protein XENTR_v10016044 [Xenopus tropicalis]
MKISRPGKNRNVCSIIHIFRIYFSRTSLVYSRKLAKRMQACKSHAGIKGPALSKAPVSSPHLLFAHTFNEGMQA